MKNKKTTEKEADRYARSDHTFRDNWIKRALKEIKFLEVKHVKTSKENETEPVLLFRKKKTMQLAHSKVAYFSAYCFQPGKRNIIKVSDDETSQLAYDWLTNRIQVLENNIKYLISIPVIINRQSVINNFILFIM